jgi:hypothetical protein
MGDADVREIPLVVRHSDDSPQDRGEAVESLAKGHAG